MAESQLDCLDDNHINERIPDSRAEFYYSEQQRLAIDELIENGEQAFKDKVKKEKMKEFLSAKELKMLRKHWCKYDITGREGGESEGKDHEGDESLYWPVMSDVAIPTLDLGWPIGGYYKGVTRVTVYTHPPKENAPHIKAVVRKLIQEAQKVIAVVMDHFTDYDIFRDMVDAGCKRKVPVYIVLDEGGLQYFLEMCQRMEFSDFMLRSLRVRTLPGIGFLTATGKIRGGLNHKFMLIDGDKVMSGSYCFTWTASRIDRNIITVMTGQITEAFDIEFRELYASSEEVNLHKELNIPQYKLNVNSNLLVTDKATAPSSNLYPSPLAQKLMVNPKYALVTGVNLTPNDMISTSSSSRKPVAGLDMKTEDANSRIQRYLDTIVDTKEEEPPIPEYISEPGKKKRTPTLLDSKSKSPDGKKGEKDRTETANGPGTGEANFRRSKKFFPSLFKNKERSSSRVKRPSQSELPNGDIPSVTSVTSGVTHDGSLVIVEKEEEQLGPQSTTGPDKMTKDKLGSRISASLQSLVLGARESLAGDGSTRLRRRPSKRGGCAQS